MNSTAHRPANPLAVSLAGLQAGMIGICWMLAWLGLGVLLPVGWYYLWFRVLGQTLMPLVWLLHAETSTAFGHVIFGAMIARFPAYLPRLDQPAPPAPAPEPPGEAVPPDPGLN